MQQCVYCGQVSCKCGANRYAEVTVTEPTAVALGDITTIVWGTDTNNDFFYNFEAGSETRFRFHIPKDVFYRDLPAKYGWPDPYRLCHVIHTQLAALLETRHDIVGAYNLISCLDRGELPAAIRRPALWEAALADMDL